MNVCYYLVYLGEHCQQFRQYLSPYLIIAGATHQLDKSCRNLVVQDSGQPNKVILFAIFEEVSF